jgi:hypothetical protein
MLPSRRHSFTHFQLDIQPVLALSPRPPASPTTPHSAWIDPARRGPRPAGPDPTAADEVAEAPS